MVDPNFITDMMGILFWILAIIAIHWVLKEPFKARRQRMKEKRANWREWWRNLSRLKQIYFCLIIIVSPVFFGSFLFIFPYFIIEIYNGTAPFNELALALFAILSALGALFGFYTSIINTETTEQGHITDRINKAIENLGKNDDGGYPVIEVRIGALYALERIAQDSIRDYIQILEILCAYIRHNSPSPYKADTKPSVPDNVAIKPTRKKNKGEKIDEDIQAALTIIGRRHNWSERVKRLKKERRARYRVDLNGCNLHGADLLKANLTNAGLIAANLSYARLNDANLNGASLGLAILVGTWFERATLKKTRFRGAKTNLARANKCDFSNSRELTQKQLDVMYCGKDTEIPKMDGKKKLTRPKHWPKDKLADDKFIKMYYKWKKTL